MTTLRLQCLKCNQSFEQPDPGDVAFYGRCPHCDALLFAGDVQVIHTTLGEMVDGERFGERFRFDGDARVFTLTAWLSHRGWPVAYTTDGPIALLARKPSMIVHPI